MEEEIHFTNNDFDFNNLTLSQPIAVQGGAYFTKIKFKSDPLYIQTPKCLTKQGINETSKKAYLDLMYSTDNEDVIEWFENLESTLINLIFQKKHLWFQDDIEHGDIESFFNQITRAYKGGKYHLIRTSIAKNKSNNQYTCKVYDENENILPIGDIKEHNLIIPIIEILGIKFSARSFQVELIGKQIMVLNNKPLFNSCLIKRKSNPSTMMANDNTNSKELLGENTSVEQNIPNENNENNEYYTLNDNESGNEPDSNDTKYNESTDKCVSISDNYTHNGHPSNSDNYSNDDLYNQPKSILEVTENNAKINSLEELSNVKDLEDISQKIIVNSEQQFTLKKPNEVYYEIYKIAKQKAKQHKKATISAYLEAKKIKNTYLLEDLDNNSDSSEDENYDSDSDYNSIKREINDIIEDIE
jgi:hypothetical protein